MASKTSAPGSLSTAVASQLAAIVTSSEDAIIGLSLDRRVTTWNAAATRLFGYEERAILGARTSSSRKEGPRRRLLH